jgi:NIMA (never in mitosis gene a)-related kinase
MPIEDFEIGKILGKGAYSSVVLVKRYEDNKTYAMKRVKIGQLSYKDKQNALNEIRILASLSHINIIGYKEAFFDDITQTLNIVMEYAEDGDLQSKIKTNKKKNYFFQKKQYGIFLFKY